jgi:hypothetical protein
MKRVVLGLVAIVFAASVILAFAVSNAKAYPPNRYHHGPYYHKWVPSPPPGKSVWCKNHPKKCYVRGTHDPKVNTKWEYCIDEKGNGDGYISPWEIKQFGKTCNP